MKLKPCPFCGSNDVKVVSGMNFVACYECESDSGVYDSKEEAVKAWNRRVK